MFEIIIAISAILLSGIIAFIVGSSNWFDNLINDIIDLLRKNKK